MAYYRNANAQVWSHMRSICWTSCCHHFSASWCPGVFSPAVLVVHLGRMISDWLPSWDAIIILRSDLVDLRCTISLVTHMIGLLPRQVCRGVDRFIEKDKKENNNVCLLWWWILMGCYPRYYSRDDLLMILRTL